MDSDDDISAIETFICVDNQQSIGYKEYNKGKLTAKGWLQIMNNHNMPEYIELFEGRNENEYIYPILMSKSNVSDDYFQSKSPEMVAYNPNPRINPYGIHSDSNLKSKNNNNVHSRTNSYGYFNPYNNNGIINNQYTNNNNNQNTNKQTHKHSNSEFSYPKLPSRNSQMNKPSNFGNNIMYKSITTNNVLGIHSSYNNISIKKTTSNIGFDFKKTI